MDEEQRARQVAMITQDLARHFATRASRMLGDTAELMEGHRMRGLLMLECVGRLSWLGLPIGVEIMCHQTRELSEPEQEDLMLYALLAIWRRGRSGNWSEALGQAEQDFTKLTRRRLCMVVEDR